MSFFWRVRARRYGARNTDTRPKLSGIRVGDMHPAPSCPAPVLETLDFPKEVVTHGARAPLATSKIPEVVAQVPPCRRLSPSPREVESSSILV